jgi:aminoglycoside phosphotransferase (APT) family kinase protein
MSASKDRLRWDDLPARIQRRIEELAGDRVVVAENCEGGFSPGFASRLTLASGARVFAKAMDADAWPFQASFHRSETVVAAALPAAVPAPRFIGSSDDGHWVVLAFECVTGREPTRPWRIDELGRVVAAIGVLAAATTPSPVAVPADHPRLGGWAEVASDRRLRARLAAHSDWAAEHAGLLAAIEGEGLVAARGSSLVHFDALPHNILLTPDRVLFVDWPHARLGAPFIDLLMMLISAAADGIDPEPLLRDHPAVAGTDPRAVTGVLAALTGFCLADAVKEAPPGLEPIVAAKLELGRGALGWLRGRLSGRATSTGW